MDSSVTSYSGNNFQRAGKAGKGILGGKRGINKMEKTYVTTKEAAEYLSVTVETIYKILNKGLLTKYRPVRRIYIKKEELITLKQEGNYIES